MSKSEARTREMRMTDIKIMTMDKQRKDPIPTFWRRRRDTFDIRYGGITRTAR